MNRIFNPVAIHNPQGRKPDSNIGRILLDMGKISAADAERILLMQKEKGMRFGEAAQALGLVTEADIEQVLAHQFDYPYLRPGQGGFSPELVAAYRPFDAQVEMLRGVRSQLMLRWFGSGRKTLAIASVNPDDGASMFTANLAVVFSQLGEKTLLVDANLRSPQQHRIFNLPSGQGLSDILADRAELDAISRIAPFIDLSVLSAGTLPPNPQELLSLPLLRASTSISSTATTSCCMKCRRSRPAPMRWRWPRMRAACCWWRARTVRALRTSMPPQSSSADTARM